MNVTRLEKLAPITGIVAVVLLVVGTGLAGTFDYFPTADRAAEIFSQNSDHLLLQSNGSRK